MKLLSLAIFSLLILFSPLFAQTAQYEKGIYESFDDLVNRKTSSNPDITVEEIGYYALKNSKGKYELKSNDNSIKKNYLKNEVTAYCDGDDLYINGIKYELSAGYCKVLSTGRFIVFFSGYSYNDGVEEKQKRDFYNDKSQIKFIDDEYRKSYVKYLYYIDMLTNQCVYVRQHELNGLLSVNEDLFASYQREEKKNDTEVMLEYMVELNDFYNKSPHSLLSDKNIIDEDSTEILYPITYVKGVDIEFFEGIMSINPRFERNGNLLTKKDLRLQLKPNELAFKKIKMANLIVTSGDVLMVSGCLFVIIPLATLYDYGVEEDDNLDWFLPAIGIGVGAIIASFPFYKLGLKKQKEAVDIYNSTLTFPENTFWDNKELNISVVGTGIGLQFRF